eukprot:TRINITY_DN3584_c0_g1_i1.p1 TRINITY_DN3584_c0_g1~~TRINITY_DN3584_c0_g1_i1.p1  ORF type:complete len:468 (+),score=25.53 TRINITY_DN3584_c0_g1_i1:168-1571(+)
MEEQFAGRVVVLPAFTMGHFLPMLEFAKRLSAVHHLSVTFIVAEWQVSRDVLSKHRRELSSNNAINIRFVELPPIEVPSHITDPRKRVIAIQEITKPLLEETLLRELESAPIAAFITDFFCCRFFEVALKLHLRIYVFFVSSASFLCLMLYAPTLAQTIGLPIRDLQRTVEIPGLPPMQAKDLPDMFLEARLWKSFSHNCYLLPKAHGFLINTCLEMEKRQLKTLQVHEENKEYHAVGPLIQSALFEAAEGKQVDERLLWQDSQPAKSVLYVSFGSRLQLSPDQITELAHGLELSGQRFLWVLQEPQLPSVLQSEEHKDGKSLLPEGFLSRTQRRGLVTTEWAPQVAVLSHPSTGGFLSHCGWNSTLESIMCGVPVLTWPQGAEQRMNEQMLVRELKVGVSLSKESTAAVKREEVESAVKELMMNEQVEENMRRLSEAANTAVTEGGRSFESLAAVAASWKSKGQSA